MKSLDANGPDGLRWNLTEDGAFDLCAGTLALRRAFPAFDGVAIHPLRVEARRAGDRLEARYRLADGTVILRFGFDEDGAVLASELAGFRRAPNRVDVAGGALVEGAARFFRQGLGFGGPSGFVALDAPPPPWSFESYVVTALEAADGAALALGALDHRRFLQKCSLYDRVTRWGLVNRHTVDDRRFLDAGFATEAIPAGGRLRLPDFHLVRRPRAWDALHRMAVRIGLEMKARAGVPPSGHWCSWYRHYHYLTQEDVEELVRGFRGVVPPPLCRTMQIDDGYCPHRGDWLEPTHKFPGGLKPAFDAIRAGGYRAGIWIGPFQVGCRSRLYREHPDWVLRDGAGRPIAEWRHYEAPRPGGFRDEENYALDISHPDAVAYLRRVFRTMREWGAAFFKTDFMDWGLKDSTLVRRARPGKTGVEWYRECLAAIREEIGEDSFWLACIAPFGPFIGFADAARIGNDVGSKWSEGSTGNMIQESVAGQYFNNVWWQNDPDVLYLRDHAHHLSPDEIRSLALWDGILGGVVNTSDTFHELPPDRLALWRFVAPGPVSWTARMPYWGREGRVRVAVRDFANAPGLAVVVLNPTAHDTTERLDLADVAGRKEMFAFEWSPAGAAPLGRRSFLLPELRPHASALYYLDETGAPPPAGLTLGGWLPAPARPPRRPAARGRRAR
jgi:hypothetical protein